MVDTVRPSDRTVWETKGPFGYKVYEYEHFHAFSQMSRPVREHNLLQRNSYFGSGHLVYSGEMIYNRVNTATIVAFSFVTGEIRASRDFQDAFFEPLQPALIPSDDMSTAELVGVSDERWLKGFIKMAADENGLWAMYLQRYNTSILVVHQLDPFTLDTIFRRHIEVGEEYGDGFIICGVLYAIAEDDLQVQNRQAKFMMAYDIFGNLELPAILENITISIPRAPMSMLTYIPHRKSPALHAWGRELQFNYKIGLIEREVVVEEVVSDDEQTE